MARAAGELEGAGRVGPVRFGEREAGEEGRVGPAMGEVGAHRAEGEPLHRLAEADAAGVADEGAAVGLRAGRGAGPVILVPEQQDQRVVVLAGVEQRDRFGCQAVAVHAEEGDAVDDGPALAGGGNGMEGIRHQNGAGHRRPIKPSPPGRGLGGAGQGSAGVCPRNAGGGEGPSV